MRPRPSKPEPTAELVYADESDPAAVERLAMFLRELLNHQG